MCKEKLLHNWLVIWPRAQLVSASFKPLSAVIYELLDRPTIANIATTIEIAPFRIADFKLLPDQVRVLRSDRMLRSPLNTMSAPVAKNFSTITSACSDNITS